MIKAMRGKVILLPNEKVNETESGLQVVGSYNPELGLRRGKVISTGDGCREVEEGQEVCYMAYSGVPIRYNGETYWTMHEDEIVAVAV